MAELLQHLPRVKPTLVGRALLTAIALTFSVPFLLLLRYAANYNRHRPVVAYGAPQPVHVAEHPVSDTWHDMEDMDLLRAAIDFSTREREEGGWGGEGEGMREGEEGRESGRKGKLALLFLVRGDLPLADFWAKFLEGHESKYSIYVHSSPGHVYDEATTPKAFRRRQIPSKNVFWGKMSIVDAERRLLANALLDPLNVRFMLFSESCVPLYNFTFIYNYFMGTEQTFTEIYDNPTWVGRGRYRSAFAPEVTIKQWRKGSQWFQLNRELAVLVISDTFYYKKFEEFCIQRCYSDEHYIPTLLYILRPHLDSCRKCTYVEWRGYQAHPVMFHAKHVGKTLVRRMRSSLARTNCTWNGQLSVCFLFGRKFAPDALPKLLHLSDWMSS